MLKVTLMFTARRRLIRVVVILTLVASAYLAGCYLASLTSLLDVHGDLAYRRAAEAEFNEVLGRMGEARGLLPPEKVELKVVTQSWVEENWGRSYVEAASKEVETEGKIYKALLLIPQNASLQAIKVSQAGAAVAASVGGEVYIVREHFDPYNRLKAGETLAHELTHIIQGEYFKAPETREHDEKQAWAALIEGDADTAATEYVRAFLAPKNSSSTPTPTGYPSPPLPSGTQDPLLQVWLFPYRYGENFVNALLKDGGWTRVNQAYGNPPRTTEQIMHPAKYLDGEGYVDVEVPFKVNPS